MKFGENICAKKKHYQPTDFVETEKCEKILWCMNKQTKKQFHSIEIYIKYTENNK